MTGLDTQSPPSAAAAGHRPGWPAGLGLLLAIVGSIVFVVVFATGASTAWLGGSLAAALAGIGLALAYWGRDLAGDEISAGPYPVPPDDHEAQVAFADELERDAAVLTRRRLLFKMLAVAAAVFGVSQAVLLGALGPRPRRSLFVTQWRPGSRLVTFDGRLISRDALAGGGFLVAFPEGHTDAADSQVALLRLAGNIFTPQPGRESWSPEGFVAYSRVCTHAGCSVAQYEDEAQVLLCPCHQSTFDVLDGARPVAGPAGRPLPQLPLAIDAGGHLVAQRDFTEPVGPGFWNAG